MLENTTITAFALERSRNGIFRVLAF